jgi:hypothetical protein
MAECYGWKDLLNFSGNAGKFYPGQCDYFGGSTVLPQAIGWVIVVAFGGGKLLRTLLYSNRCVRPARRSAAPQALVMARRGLILP